MTLRVQIGTTHSPRSSRLARMLVVSTAALGLTLAMTQPGSATGAGTPAAGKDMQARTGGHTTAPSAAPRTIVTTDPELDDLNSMLRMLLYSNEMDIAGLVYSSSQHHYQGDASRGLEPHRWPAPGARLHIDEAVDAYAKVYKNLIRHDSRYPSPSRLRSLIATGNVIDEGDMAADTKGSDLIRKVLLDDKPGQVFLQAWGGPNTIARALKSIQDQYHGTPRWRAVYKKIVNKAVITSFGQQDSTFEDYIKPNWPDIQNREVATSVWGYGSRGVVRPEDAVYHSADWTRANVSGTGPIGAAYRVWGDGKQMAAGFDDEDYFGLSGYTAEELRAMGYLVWTPPQPKGSWISEGDSSNFALLVDNGLRSYQHPGWGGWGGRQVVDPDDPHRWSNQGAQDADGTGATPRDYAAARWFSAIQNDFAARLDWSVSAFADANHAPRVRVPQGLDLSRRAGRTVELTARTADPDGDTVTRTWWQYREAGTYPGTVAIRHTRTGAVHVDVPADARPGQTIHLVVEAKDDGTPALTSYQRVVITVT
ncbi:nucleoside hydrolase-like domain-containing protein [Streptomyces sp. NPDC060205]|uniref:nucleoside hydrolase-like domain-containing protein n=1 Tax=Streptomyces sp. NPDC060205 TaxID=3347072 RepID=UPI0036665535